ncbi:aspartate aminotransferase family protein [Vibrio caribbeanicus]|uniref:Aminotransferase class-III n=1 Tax=Vibrio caribbeanicus ATCC BAA-2122 TaxID=796620 RepID=E3BLC2_9VIBR|nr:aminotransferase class III-fold pyridoxal phosphate-dependent enzyme [Vibrio caribbeanicus]EFP96134.1 aminotransferase class-III [Vibrio caribbeanicus ATCC BAA-2122]
MKKDLLRSMVICPDWQLDYPKLTHGKGCYLFDDTGRKYLDAAASSSSVANLGYGVSEYGESIKKQLDKLPVFPTHRFYHEEVEDYLGKLLEFSGPDFTKAWTAMSGTEGVENALKVALQYHQLTGNSSKYKIISRQSTYHGSSVFTLDVGGMKWRRESYKPWLNNFPHISPAYSYRRNEKESEESFFQRVANELEAQILKEGPETVAAFIVEPVVAAALGAVPANDEYFKRVREICDKYNVLLIADEILTGFGRLGYHFGMEHYKVKPDIMACGKGISGGYFPLSAVVLSHKVADAFEDNQMNYLGGHTFACNPVGAVAGKVTIDYMKKHRVVENSYEIGRYFNDKLAELAYLDIVGDTRGVGLLSGIEFVKDKTTKQPFSRELNIGYKISEYCFTKGVILYPGKGSYDGILGDHIMMSPPLIIERHQVDTIVEVLEEGIKHVQENL